MRYTMKRIALILSIFSGLVLSPCALGQVPKYDPAPTAIHKSSKPVASAALEVGGTTKGFLPPRLSTVQRDAISSPASGLVIFNTDSGELERYSGGAWGAIAGGSGGGSGGVNLLAEENYDFEVGDLDWTETGSSVFSIESTNPGFGDKAGSWDAAAAGEYLSSASVTIPDALQGQRCSAVGWYSWDSGTAGHLDFEVYDGTNVVATVEAEVTSGRWREFQILFDCPSSGSIVFRLASTADAAVILIDSIHLGSDLISQDSSQARVAAEVYYAGTASCQWTRTNTASGAFSTVAACPAPTVKYSASGVTAVTTDENLPVFKFTTLPPGKYKIEIRGTGQCATAGEECTLDLRDTTDSVTLDSVVFSFNGNASGGGAFVLQATFDQETAGARNFEIYGRASAGATIVSTLSATGYVADLRMVLTQYPLESEQALKLSSAGFHVDARIAAAGGSLSLGSATDGSFTQFGASDLTLSNRTGAATAMIACASTEAASGATCSSGDEQIGFAADFPRAGKVEVCFDTSIYPGTTDDTDDFQSRFRVAESENATTTMLQASDFEKLVGTINGTGVTSRNTTAAKFCDSFTLSSAGRKTFKLQKQVTTFTAASPVMYDVRATARYITENSSVVIPDAVTVPEQGAMTECAFTIDFHSTTPTLAAEYGDCVSAVPDTGVGQSNLTLTTGFFSSAPVCTMTGFDGGGTERNCNHRSDTAPTATTLNVYCVADSSQTDDCGCMVRCIGPR
jgi:hypothetical protein